MTEQRQFNINVENDEIYTNLFYFNENAPPRPSTELSNILEKRLVPDMKTFEKDLIEMYNIYTHTTNIADIRCIRNALNIPKLAGGRSLHIATVHNPYDFDPLERERYSLFMGYAQWTRFNQLPLDDTLRLNKMQQEVKKLVIKMNAFSENITHINQEVHIMNYLLNLYKEQNNNLIDRCNILENNLRLLNIYISLLLTFIFILIILIL